MASNVGFSYGDVDSNKKGVLDVPLPTKESRQRSLGQEDLYLTRYITPWARPNNITADAWRWWVFNEPIAMICRETLIANVLALDWEITPRKSEQREELSAVIRHYTRLLEHGGNYAPYGLDWTGLVEWIMADLQDLPFGSGIEVGRKNDSPTGRVLWLKPLDGGTLYPTLNADYPVIQFYRNYNVITFPSHAIARTYMSPRPELLQEGWGLAPPEKIYFALLMLWQGDKYYANLLIDTPPAGILDLGDMEKDSAYEWVESMRNFLLGAPSSFKIPVLYEHTTKTEFIPFGKVPNDIMFDRITLKYAAIVAAAYGMSLSDIGLQTTSASGETLAGSIRQERRTKRTGFARAKKKIKYLIESILPDVLQFNFIDLDDELNVALGRARLSTITALSQAQDKGVISAKEHRLVLLGDGLMGNTSLPEEPPPDAKEMQPASPFGKTPERPGSVGSPQPPSSGGEGGTTMRSIHFSGSENFEEHLRTFADLLVGNVGTTIYKASEGVSEDEYYLVRSMVDESLFGSEDVLGILETIKSLWIGKRWFKLEKDDGLADELKSLAEKVLQEDALHSVNWDEQADRLVAAVNDNAKIFLGKSAAYVLKDILLSEDVFDIGEDVSYDNIVDKVYQSLYSNFDKFIATSAGIEAEKLLAKIQEI